MSRVKVTLSVGRCDGRDYVFAFDRETARRTIESHWAFGNPAQDSRAVSQEWVTPSQSSGWQIVSREVTATIVATQLRGSDKETQSLAWQCPYCHQSRAEEWHRSDRFPALLLCSCEKLTKFFLGIAPSAKSFEAQSPAPFAEPIAACDPFDAPTEVLP